jgi:hypothetical protein
MAVLDEAVAIAMQNIDISGYGSRVALCLPGTTWMDLSVRISNSPGHMVRDGTVRLLTMRFEFTSHVTTSS